MSDSIRVILLDDEVLIRKLVRMKLDTEKLKLDIVGEYSNAASVIEQLEEIRPDIIISDICMPGMDGISFSEQCTKILPNIKIIILTGYNDFEYARRSLKAGVYDYLMKPVQKEELNASVERLVQQIYKERQVKESHRKMVEEREVSIPLLRSSYIRRLLMSDSLDENLKQKLISYGVCDAADMSIMREMGIIMAGETVYNPDSLLQIVKETEQFFEDDKNVYVVTDPWGRLVLLSQGENQDFQECYNVLLEMLAEKWNYHFQCGYFKDVVNMEGVKTLYTATLEDMRAKYSKQKTETLQSQMQAEDWIKKSPLMDMIRKGDVEKVNAAVVQLFKTIQEDIPVKINKAEMKQLFERICTETEQTPAVEKFEKKLSCCRCEADLMRCFENAVTNLAMDRALILDAERGQAMREIIVYLSDNLANQDINMNYLASKYAMSASLLGRMFKRFIGKSYSELMSELRFWKMLELLANDSQMLDRDIGSVIGIDDPHYLSIWFRKMTGCSVTEYRKMRCL
ncbi:MAG: response regulator [Lachnospiraceae bacterium]|nr:response regulator [Lachnospiraceae bacterium]